MRLAYRRRDPRERDVRRLDRELVGNGAIGPRAALERSRRTFGLVGVVIAVGRTRPAITPLTVAAHCRAYWFTGSTSFANPAVTIGPRVQRHHAGIRPGDAGGRRGAVLVAGAVARGVDLDRHRTILEALAKVSTLKKAANMMATGAGLSAPRPFD